MQNKCSKYSQSNSGTAVLVAIAIPVFTTQLEKSREATDLANIRSGYAEAMTAYLSGDTSAEVWVETKQTKDGWDHVAKASDGNVYIGAGIEAKSTSSGSSSNTGKVQVKGKPVKGGYFKITVADNATKPEDTVTIQCYQSNKTSESI